MKIQKIPQHLHSSLIDTFVELPTDTDRKLSEEQLNSLFSNQKAWNEVIKRTLKQKGLRPSEISE